MTGPSGTRNERSAGSAGALGTPAAGGAPELATLDELISLLERLHGVTSTDAAGLTEGDHALQTAAVLAEDGDDPELVVAGLVHDIGHQFGPDDRHAALGASAVRRVLGPRVAALVGAHVAAKRYLVTVDPAYRSRLTGGSVATLARQGGDMSDAEVTDFAGRPESEDAVTLRRADESAKVPGRPVPPLRHWVPLLRQVAARASERGDPPGVPVEGGHDRPHPSRASPRSEGLVRRRVCSGPGLDDLRAWTAQTRRWPVGSHRWGQYAERTERGDVVCRTENVSACHPGLAELVRGPLRRVAEEALGEDAADFKDKVNYKEPGGAGFRPHQDLPAYPGASRVVSLLLAVDPCTVESGCLWVAPEVDELLPVDERGVVRSDVARGLSWQPVELDPGDLLVIDGRLPHRSERNTSLRSRRVLVVSYAPVADGYRRENYYEARRREMGRPTATATGPGQHPRISVLGDFAGSPAEKPAPEDRGAMPAACSHPPARA